RAAASRPRTCGASASPRRCPRPARSASADRPVVDDADDAGIDRRLDRIERKTRFLAPHEKHVLAHAGADRIHRDERLACRLAIRCQRLDDEQLDADQVLVLAGRDDVADHSGDLHQSAISTASMMPTMAASTGQSFRPDAMRAELPLTTSTVSPTPASTVSTATSGAPSALPCESTARTTMSLLLTSRGSFR